MEQSTMQISRPPRLPKVWIEEKHLSQVASKLTRENVRVKKHRRQSKGAGNWEFRNGKVNLNSIPAHDRDRYGILRDTDRILEVLEGIKTTEAQARRAYNAQGIDEDKAEQVYCSMAIAKKEAPIYFNKIGEQHNLKTKRRKEFSERWAVWVWILENYERFPLCLETYHTAYCKIFPAHFKGANGKISFKNFLNNCRANGIEAAIIDRRAVVTAQKRRSEFQLAFLQAIYRQERKVTAADAYRKLVAACEAKEGKETPMSHANVKIIFREFANNQELYAARYGASAAQKLMPYQSLEPAIHRNTQWQADGWVLPFWVGKDKESGKGFNRYVLYKIHDNHSRKIIGYNVAKSEDTTLILSALESALENTGVFPAELVMDSHSFTKTKIAERLMQETNGMGAAWTITTNAQRNQLTERYNQHLDAICKDYTGYLGKNITATSKDARPSDEHLAILAKPANQLTEEEIQAIGFLIVDKFNKSPLTALEGMTPTAKYEASEDKKCFSLTDTQRLQLLRPATTYKVIRGQITIKVGNKKHEFQLPAHLYNEYNNRELYVIYEDLTQGIYISDPRTGVELGAIEPKFRIHGAVADQTDEDRRRIAQASGRNKGIRIPASKKAEEQLVTGLKDNPEAALMLASHIMPKDARQEAISSSEAKKYGINPNNMPIRAQKPVLPAKATPTTNNGKSSPYTATNNDMRRISLEDILGTQPGA